MNTGGPASLSLRSTNYLIYNSPKSCLITLIAYRCQQPNCGLGKQLGIWMPWRTGTILMRSSSTKVAAAENQGSLEDKKKSKWPLNWSGTVNSSGGQQSEIWFVETRELRQRTGGQACITLVTDSRQEDLEIYFFSALEQRLHISMRENAARHQ